MGDAVHVWRWTPDEGWKIGRTDVVEKRKPLPYRVVIPYLFQRTSRRLWGGKPLKSISYSGCEFQGCLMGIWPDVFPLDTGLGSGGVRDGAEMFPRSRLWTSGHGESGARTL